MKPAVSILMAVRDGSRWVDASITSVTSQTFRDFELIVVDDGSIDDTACVVADLANRDPRVRFERLPARGLTVALNHALSLARAPLLARLDADDLAHPERLARQVAYLRAHPRVGLLGTSSYEISHRGVRLVRSPVDDRSLRSLLIRRNPFTHSSVMVRASLVRELGGYDERFAVAQDYDLWLRLSRVTELASIDLPLVTRRIHVGSVSATRVRARRWAEARARLRAVRADTYPPWCAVYAVRPLLACLWPGVGDTRAWCNPAPDKASTSTVRALSVSESAR